jgi:hypothetical protein
MSSNPEPLTPGVDLYWLPLGAGGSFVKFNGRVFEALQASVARRRALDLYHSALVVNVAEASFVIEITPVPDPDGHSRGVVAEGAVGSRHVARFRIFRYELHCWPAGEISDVAQAVDSPRRLTGDEADARRLLGLLPLVPMKVWGRDELHAGEMWNSNSVIAWLLVRCGFPIEAIHPPPGGRAPGWAAGIVVANRATDTGASTQS